MDKISIITVTYNASATLEAAIKSVKGQTYPLIEYIIIDGGSTDNTVELLERYQPELAYCISEKDNGIYDAMNKGLAAATGEWIFFLGADDVFCNHKVIEQALNVAGTSEVHMLYGNVRLKSNDNIFGGARTYRELIGKNINHQSIFYRRSVFQLLGNFDLRYPVLADYEMNLRVFRNEGLIKKYVPLDICIFNDKGGASNVRIDYSFFRDMLIHFTSVEKIPADAPELQQYYFYSGFVDIFKYRRFQGFRNSLKALSSGPRKFYYSLVFIKLGLSWFGIGKKMKIV